LQYSTYQGVQSLYKEYPRDLLHSYIASTEIKKRIRNEKDKLFQLNLYSDGAMYIYTM